jgi:tetratricopeptide (TPR) repeat protein
MVALSYFRVMKQLLLVLSLLFSLCTKAEKVYDFDATCQQAYQELFALRINNGWQLIKKAKLEKPDNLIPVLLENYADFFVLFLNEDPADYQQKKALISKRLKLLEEGPENHPFHRIAQASIYLQRAAVEIRFGAMRSAGFDGWKAYRLLKENDQQFPGFAPNDLYFGAVQAVAGTIPKGYQWLAGLFGIKGSLKGGIQRVYNFSNGSGNWQKILQNDAAFLYCYLTFYFGNEKDAALNFIQQKKLDLVHTQLFTFMTANLAIQHKKMDYALSVIQNREKSAAYLSSPIWDFQLGYVQLGKLNMNEAIRHFEQFLNDFKGNFYVKDVWLRLSWCYYIQGKMAAANFAKQQAVVKGTTDSDADKQALREAQKPWPNTVLLKARILNDGGYNKEALAVLAGKSSNDFEQQAEKLEFIYRYARILDDLEQDDAALKYYRMVIDMGRNRTEYFAARAALQSGMILEKKGFKDKAITAYEECLNMEGHSFKNSLDQRAKSGIARCKKGLD